MSQVTSVGLVGIVNVLPPISEGKHAFHDIFYIDVIVQTDVDSYLSFFKFELKHSVLSKNKCLNLFVTTHSA